MLPELVLHGLVYQISRKSQFPKATVGVYRLGQPSESVARVCRPRQKYKPVIRVSHQSQSPKLIV